MTAPRPPRLHRLALHLLVRGEDAEFVIGDVEEDWARIRGEDGAAAARAWYRRHARATIAAWWLRDRRNAWERWRRELLLAARSLARSPGFAVTTVTTLALGLGGAAAVGTLARSALRPLPYPDADRLVAVWETEDGRRHPVAPANYLDWRRTAQSFTALAAVHVRSASVTVDGTAGRGRVAVVSGNLFRVLGVEAVVGRTFDPAFDPAFPGLEAVLSHGAWIRLFDGSPDAVGRSFMLDEVTYQIVGVAPPEVEYPEPELFGWVRSRTEAPEIAGFPSLDALREMRDAWYFDVVGRLRPGSDLDMARQEMVDLAGHLARAFPDTNEGHSALLVPLADQAVEGLGPLIAALVLAVVLVLLATGVNVAHLTWARSTARSAETAVRRALGAGGRDLLRPFLAEGALLGLAGGATGLGLAAIALRAGTVLLDDPLARGGATSLDGAVSGTVLVLGSVAGMTVAALGFLRSRTAGDLAEGLRTSRHGHRFRQDGIVVAQVATAIALLSGAGLLTRSVVNLAAVDPGFEVAGLATLQVALPDARSRPYARRIALYEDLLDDLRALPGVGAAGFAADSPLSMGARAGVRVVGTANEDPRDAGWQPVSPEYFAALGVPLVGGRAFRESDAGGAPDVGIVNETFARRILGAVDPLGAEVTMGLDGHDRPVTIVGVVADMRTRGPALPPGPVLYRPARQTVRASAAAVFFAVRVADAVLTPAALADWIRQTAPGLPVYGASEGAALTRPFRRTQTAILSVLAVFAGTVLLLGVVGIYGVAAHGVAERRRELGLRLALGSGKARVVGDVVGAGLRGTLAGLPLGLALAFFLGRALRTVLFGVGPADPVVLAAVCALVLAVTALALLVPASSAARTDPARAMRSD